MASSKEYLDFILDQLSELNEIDVQPMMGEYLIYYGGKIAGGIFDDRFLVKPVPSAVAYMPEAPYETPYPGGKPMLLVEDIDSRAYLSGLFKAIYDELPVKKKPGKRRLGKRPANMRECPCR